MVILSRWNCLWTDSLPETYIPFPAPQQPGKGCFSGCEFIRLCFIMWRWQAWRLMAGNLDTVSCEKVWNTTRPSRGHGLDTQTPITPGSSPNLACTLPRLDATRHIFNIHKGGGNHCLPNSSLPLIHLLSSYRIVRKWKNWFFKILHRFPLRIYLESIFVDSS